ncbi:MAG: cytochrome P450 [Deltaproteobacteria bacterium]|nr:cytochrome P450 [Deltaproteobacteria bacterium]
MTTTTTTPPLLPGLPLLGNALQFRNDPLALFRSGYEKLGPVFGIKLAFQPAVVLVGAERIRFFFEQTDAALSMSEVYQFLVPILGGRVLFTAEPDEYAEQKRIMLPAFQGKKLKSYVGAMATEVSAWLDTLGERGEFELIDVAEKLTMNMVSRAVFGDLFRERLGDDFQQLFVDLSGGLEFVLPTNLPLPRFRRRDRALKKLQTVLGQVVAERRKNPDAYDDFLQVLVGATYMNEAQIPDDKVVMMLVGMLFGGRENTAGHLAWCVVQLLKHAPWLEKVRAEVDANLAPTDTPDYDKLRALTNLDLCLKETDRLRPMTVTLVRYTAKAYEMDGFTIPKGWLTVAGIALTQRLPETFKDPETWDPDRFSPARKEETPYSIANFGGGHHRCWAQSFVNYEIKTVIALLLRSYHVSLVSIDGRRADPPTETNSIGVTRPQQPCRVRYHRRQADGS